MNLVLKRIAIKSNYTIGKLYINGSYFCNTLEDKVREEKIAGITAIPEGTYEVTVNRSPKFKRNLPLIMDVPNFEGIRIHRGNTADDTSGCILVGENKIKGKLVNSTKYEKQLTKMLINALKQGQEIRITICNGKKTSPSV